MIEFKGSKWYKCDLHLHTISSECFANREVTPEQWVDRALSATASLPNSVTSVIICTLFVPLFSNTLIINSNYFLYWKVALYYREKITFHRLMKIHFS
jgi:hypothetical protein